MSAVPRPTVARQASNQAITQSFGAPQAPAAAAAAAAAAGAAAPAPAPAKAHLAAAVAATASAGAVTAAPPVPSAQQRQHQQRPTKKRGVQATRAPRLCFTYLLSPPPRPRQRTKRFENCHPHNVTPPCYHFPYHRLGLPYAAFHHRVTEYTTPLLYTTQGDTFSREKNSITGGGIVRHIRYAERAILYVKSKPTECKIIYGGAAAVPVRRAGKLVTTQLLRSTTARYS